MNAKQELRHIVETMEGEIKSQGKYNQYTGLLLMQVGSENKEGIENFAKLADITDEQRLNAITELYKK